MNKIEKTWGGHYETPVCEEFTMLSEGTVLSASGADGMLNAFDDNDIYTESFN